MKILSISTRSDELEFYLFEMDNSTIVTKGTFSRISLEDSYYTISFNSEKITEHIIVKNYDDVVNILLDKLSVLNIISSSFDIKGIGFRVVHGGSKYTESVFINDKVIQDVNDLSEFAPLYNDSISMAMRSFKKILPDTPMVAVFDTAFNQTIAEENYLYPVPLDWYEKYGIRKYGFYGTSHKYVTQKVSELLDRDNFKLISCHLGNGGSVSAIENMKVVDTSMGFTPLSGIMMGTRSGDIDPSIIPYIMKKEGLNVGEVLDELNNNSGVYGLSQYSGDMREILEECDKGNVKTIMAKNKFVRSVADYIGKYYVLLGGVDVIVFTAGIGENSVQIRREICEKLACFGVKIDLDLNNNCGEIVKISTNKSKVQVYVIPTEEELMVALDTEKLIKNR